MIDERHPQRSSLQVQDLFFDAIQHHQVGQLPAAERLYRRILAEDPRHADTLHLLGVIAHQVGQNDVAVDLIGKAIAVNRTVAAYHSDLGLALHVSGRLIEAVAAYGAALCLKPDTVEVHYNLGIAQYHLGRLIEAVATYGMALRLKPDYAEAHSNLGIALYDLDRFSEAAAAYHAALCLKPDHAEALSNLGIVLSDRGRLDAAVAVCNAAIRLKPDFAEARYNLGNALKDFGRLDDAVAAYGVALGLDPKFAEAEMNLAFTQMYRSRSSLADILAHSLRWNERHADRLHDRWPSHACPTQPSRRPRIGIVSADFRSHAVGVLAAPAIEGLTRAGYHLTCYSNSVKSDDLTTRFVRAAAQWRPVTGLSDEALADLIQADGIDILIDLSGFSAGNRLLAFARKPAPVQVASWVGYPGTTGMAAMDYILADRWQIPDDAMPFYTEQVVRLPDSYIAFEPPSGAPPLSELPALANGFVTFGSFNVLPKITSEVVARWSSILARLPTSRLLMKTVALNCAATQRHYTEQFVGHGIGPDRLTFLGGSSHAEHLAAMARTDIAIDPFPYSGGLTTLECLWTGLPVVTLPGETFASRHSLGYLSTIGLCELAATDPKGYVDRAVDLARDLPRLAHLRETMRHRLLASPLCDVERFAEHLGTALTTMWTRWCDGLPPVGFDVPAE